MRSRRGGLAAALVVLFTASARAQDVAATTSVLDLPVLGTFAAKNGKVTVRRSGDELIADGTIGGRDFRGRARVVPGMDLAEKFTLDLEPTVGIAGRLVDEEGSGGGTLVLERSKGGFKASLEEPGRAAARASLERKKRALLVYATGGKDEGAFKVYAGQTASDYEAAGYASDILPTSSWNDVVAKLEDAEATGAVYDRVIVVGHGGWDGPILGGGQVSPTSSRELYDRFGTALRRGTTPEARIFLSACHSGGSNIYERAKGYRADVYVDDLAKLSGRTVAGPAGLTSTEYTRRAAKAALEGVGTVPQETRIATAAGGKTVGAKSAPGAPPVLTPEERARLLNGTLGAD